ncbi:bifunctional Cysteine peptidase [Babesia duncani]|uniref:Bifunctional Cysteine peptidase n=1 Tax=Babesia duncani TaxID=323732 RepID=A0AAD9UMT7_9APIC|nr:bifunctional Cysteine peptidase [Babesia duncani]
MVRRESSILVDSHLSAADEEIGSNRSSSCPHTHECGRCPRNRRRILLYVILGIVTAICVGLGSYLIYRLVWNAKIETYKTKLNAFIDTIEDENTKELYRKHADTLVKFYAVGNVSDNYVIELSDIIEFDNFNKEYNKTHKNDKEAYKCFVNYKNNVELIVNHNTREGETYTMGINKFADLSKDEIKRMLKAMPSKEYINYISEVTDGPKKTPEFEFRYKQAKGLPSNAYVDKPIGEGIDWRRCDVISTPRDQGTCGSCWAFATIAAVEAMYKIENAMTYILSEQELVSCDENSYGCSGGFSDSAMKYIINHGVSSKENYPYDGTDRVCSVPAGDKISIESYESKSGQAILDELLVAGPPVVYIGISSDLIFYKSGIYNGACDTLNHAMLLVGEEANLDSVGRHFILKNSWGTDWGENGFIRIERLGDGVDKCGVLTVGFKPLPKEDALH